MAITVCHYPPGTSKWNKIEHRLFSFISLNWKGKPLINFETVVNLIGGTRTRTGLKVKAILDTNQYETGVELSKKNMEQLRPTRHKTHPGSTTRFRPAMSAKPCSLLRNCTDYCLTAH
jgi:Rhodopirellula transposase DDE domain